MSARSPRSSLSGASSAEVAEDFGESLKDLQINNRYEISTLTVIAKENTEHAQAISKTLENHIKTTAPSKKLPALYVLDSIVKNVGTPYTVYLGRNLYSTFMDAYTLVDGTTRRNMEGMLKTWKEQVPGSMDPRPVFPTETVRPIENALIKAKTAALHSNRQVNVQGQPHPDYRNTPTPPQHNGQFSLPPYQTQNQPSYGFRQQVSIPSAHHASPDRSADWLQPPKQFPAQTQFTPTPSQNQSYQYPPPDSQPVSDVESTKRDLAAIVAQRQAQARANPYDSKAQDLLNPLLQLQNYLSGPNLDPATLPQIRAQVTSLSQGLSLPPKATPQPSIPTSSPWQPSSSMPQTTVSYSQPQFAQSQATAPLFAPGALNGLQALLSNGQKPGTPQIRAAAPALQNASHSQLNNLQNLATTAPAFDGSDLMASLARNGLLPSGPSNQPTPSAGAPLYAPPSQSASDLLQSLQGLRPQGASQTATPTLAPSQLASRTGKPSVPMNSAQLKTFRPELVYALYEAQPNQCSTCGRRFLATDEGRAKKDRHLDWHFRTNQRMADPSISRGAHRDWFLPEIDWINLTDFDPSTTTAADAAGAGNQAAAKKQQTSPQDQYVRAPPGVTKNTCDICFEEMESTYSAELQDWIFTNAVAMPGGKIVHAKCLAEMKKGAEQQQGPGRSLAAALAAPSRRSATPESRLGKRKHEG